MTVDKLKISKGVSLPVDAVTQTFGILAKRGVGKTNTAVVMTEEMLDAGQQVVILDPVDVWWGLRSSADGKSAGYPITVLGGEHADLPLAAEAGAVIAEFVVENRVSVILSLRHFSMSEQRRFVTDFCERLYHLKGQDKNRNPLHIMIDEADEFVPQRIQAGHERLFGSIDRIVRRGRASGLGVTLISQRAAVVNKDVLTQIEVLVCLRTISPQDRKALEAWIEAHDAHDQRKSFMESLASLAIGEAWIWSPGWLDLFKRVQIRARRTFDSSATPKAGQVAAAPKRVAAVDLEKLRAAMTATIEKAKAEDPRELRKKIAELNTKLKMSDHAANQGNVQSALKQAHETGYQQGAFEGEAKTHGEFMQKLADIRDSVDLVANEIRKAMGTIPHPAKNIPKIVEKIFQPVKVIHSVPPVQHFSPDSCLPAAERKILTALAQYPDGRTKVQVAILAGYAVGGGGFNNSLSALRRKGCIEGLDPIRITTAGRDVLGPVHPLPTGQDLLDHWINHGGLGKAERQILSTLASLYPAAATKEELGHRTGYEPGGGGFNNAISRLRTLELISGRGELQASEVFFQ